MDFFDKLGKTASEAYKVTADKTTKIAKEAKMKLRISDLKSKIEEKYEQIGEVIYTQYCEGKKTINISKDLEEELKFIEESNKEIDELLEQCLDINDKKICLKCSAKIEKDVRFCPECGAKQPKETVKKEEPKKEEEKQAPVAEVEVIEEITVEKVPEKNTQTKNQDDKEIKKEVTKKVTTVNTKKEKKDEK